MARLGRQDRGRQTTGKDPDHSTRYGLLTIGLAAGIISDNVPQLLVLLLRPSPLNIHILDPLPRVNVTHVVVIRIRNGDAGILCLTVTTRLAAPSQH